MRRQPARQRRRARGCTQPRAREHTRNCRRVRPPSGARCAPRGAGGHSRAPRTSASARASRAPWALSCESAHAAFPPPPPRRSARRTCAAPRVAARVRGVAHPPEAPASNIPNIAAGLGPPQGARNPPRHTPRHSAALRRAAAPVPGPAEALGRAGSSSVPHPTHHPRHAPTGTHAPPPWTAAANVHAHARKQRSARLPHPPRVDTMVVVEYKGRRHTFKPSPSAPASELLEAALSAPQLGAPGRSGITGATSPHTRPSARPSGAWLLVRACGRAAD